MDDSLKRYCAEAVRYQLRLLYYYMRSKDHTDYIPKLPHETTRKQANKLQKLVEQELKE